MTWNFEAELKIYKQLKAQAIMPPMGQGYCIEVLKDGSFQRIDFRDLDHRGETMRKFAVEHRVAALFCNIDQSLCGFCGHYLHIMETFPTGEILEFAESDYSTTNTKTIDKKRLKLEMMKLAEVLTKEQTPKGFA